MARRPLTHERAQAIGTEIYRLTECLSPVPHISISEDPWYYRAVRLEWVRAAESIELYHDPRHNRWTVIARLGGAAATCPLSDLSTAIDRVRAYLDELRGGPPGAEAC